MDCDLPIDEGCCARWGDYDEDQQARAVSLAWSTLRTLTAGRVGNCPIVARPCRSGCGPIPTWLTFPATLGGVVAPGAGYFGPAIVGGRWFNIACGCGASNGCSCSTVCEIRLPGEVASIEAVEIDGVTLDPEAYRVDDGNRLVRQDDDCWPLCQDMNAPLGETGTFGVTYTPGVPVDANARYAAGVLACEFASACAGGKCRLPANVTQIARQGVTLTLAGAAFADGLTGIREVDVYVASLNPHHLHVPSVVWTPGPRARTTT